MSNQSDKIRNIAIIAHVDHGKTTLVDKLLQQSGTLERKNESDERIMDSNDQERERGITILAKNTAIDYKNYRINIVDTPGHADFGGEVERALSMVDCVLLLVDATDGPMPQTRFVTQKAFHYGLYPIVIVNKVDKPSARPNWVIDQMFDLFDSLGANDQQLDFTTIYASAINGIAGYSEKEMADDMTPLFDTIIKNVQPPKVDIDGPLQMQISALDYSSYVGVIGIGRITRGSLKPNQNVCVIDAQGALRKGRVLQTMTHLGLKRIETQQAFAGDIVCITGLEKLNINDTICDPNQPEAITALTVDEPTISMTFQVNDSPFAGQDGKFLTSRQIKDRLEQELLHNVALRVEAKPDSEKFIVSGRGELHLSVLIENMRREGFELSVSRPEVIIREEGGKKLEPYEQLIIDCEQEHQGSIIEILNARGGVMHNMTPDAHGRIRLEYTIPSRALIGFRPQFLTLTSGGGVMTSIFDKYDTMQTIMNNKRTNGSLISMATGKAVGYSLFTLQERGKLFVSHGDQVYEGMIIGIHSRENDLNVNPTKGKKVDNMRASGSEENIILVPPINLTLEKALSFIDDDELIEITPERIRVRKKYLQENERKRNTRK